MSRISEPVTFGIPVPKEENILSLNSFAVVDENGSEVPSQLRVLSRYNREVNDKAAPVRVILIDFQTDLTRNQTRIFSLQRREKFSEPVQGMGVESDNGITVSTGKIVVTINKARGTLFDQVSCDGKKFFPDDNAGGIFVEAGGKEYTSLAKPSATLIEENGPLRTVVRIEGLLRDTEGHTLVPEFGTNPLSYTVWLQFFKDKSYVKVISRLENENLGWSIRAEKPVHSIDLDSYNLSHPLVLGKSKTFSYQNEILAFTEDPIQLIQDETSDGTKNTYKFGYVVRKGDTPIKSGKKFNSFVAVSDSEKGVLTANRWFWQKFPKAYSVGDDQFNIELLPARNTSYRFLGGIHITNELVYDFQTGKGDNKEAVASLKKRLIARCTEKDYYTKVNYFDPIAPQLTTSRYTFPAKEKLQPALTYHSESFLAKFNLDYIEKQSSPNTFQAVRDQRLIKLTESIYQNWYGWLYFGNTPRGKNFGASSQHYEWAYIGLLGLLRFGEYEIWDIGEELVSYKADVIVLHDRDVPGPDLYSSRRDFAGGHRYEWDSLLDYHKVYAKSTNAPAKSSHFWIRDLGLQYLLTGEMRYYQALIKSADHLLYHYKKIRKCDIGVCAEIETRNMSRAIGSLVDVYKITGKKDYLNMAVDIFSNGILEQEAEINGLPTGWLDISEVKVNSRWSPDNSADAKVFFEAIVIEPVIKLYDTLKSDTRYEEARRVYSYIKRKAWWSRDKLLNNFAGVDTGEYRKFKTEYFPYSTKQYWKDGVKYQLGTPNNDFHYALAHADLFAFMYKNGEGEDWLQLARVVYKDAVFYQNSGAGDWQDTRHSAPKTEGFLKNPGSAFLKVGKILLKPTYYLITEWEEYKQ